MYKFVLIKIWLCFNLILGRNRIVKFEENYKFYPRRHTTLDQHSLFYIKFTARCKMKTLLNTRSFSLVCFAKELLHLYFHTLDRGGGAKMPNCASALDTVEFLRTILRYFFLHMLYILIRITCAKRL